MYDEHMQRIRFLLTIILALSLTAQSWAVVPCSCDSHGDDAVMAAPDSGGDEHDHAHHGGMPAHDAGMTDSEDSADCDAEAAACQCQACVGFVGLVPLQQDAVSLAIPRDDTSHPRYVGPPASPAFRPPIHIL